MVYPIKSGNLFNGYFQISVLIRVSIWLFSLRIKTGDKRRLTGIQLFRRVMTGNTLFQQPNHRAIGV